MSPKRFAGSAHDGAPMTDRKQAILDAMLVLIAERGLDKAPMSLVARRSGASAGVIYHHFAGGKDEMIQALYRRTALAKRAALLDGYSDTASPRDTFLKLWRNAYVFFRDHPREMRFLDQYQHSRYCAPLAAAAALPDNPIIHRIQALSRPKKDGGLFKDLPPEALDGLSFGLAASLARSPIPHDKATLDAVAATVWEAIAAPE